MPDIIATTPMSRRSFIAKSALTAGTLAGSSALLDACGGSSSSRSGTTTITVLYGTELPDAGVKAFEKANPDIKVKNTPFDATKLSAMLASGTPPDAVRIDGAPQLPNFAARGVAADLSSYFQNSKVIKESDLQPINDVYRWDGKQQGQGPRYGLVKDWSQDVMIWYNKKLFDQAKVPYPDANKPMSYDDLLATAKKLTVVKDNKIQVYGLSPSWGWNTQGHILQHLAQVGTTFFSSDLTKVDFTTPEVRKVFQWYVDWAQAHVGPSPVDPDPAFDGSLFLADRVAMITYGYWFGGYIGTATNGLPDHVGFAPTPQWGSDYVSSCFGATGIFIPKNSKNKDAAWRFIEYFFGGEGALARAKSGWGLPATKSLLSAVPQTPAYEKQAIDVQQQELQSFKILHFSPYISNDAMNAAISKYIEPVMKGQGSLDAGLKQLNDAVNLLMQQGKEQVG